MMAYVLAGCAFGLVRYEFRGDFWEAVFASIFWPWYVGRWFGWRVQKDEGRE